jgi:hypothetical protein
VELQEAVESMGDEDQDQILAEANTSLLRRREELAAAENRKRPGSVARALATANRCARCHRPVEHVGVCSSCAGRERAEAIAEAIAPALDSIPAAYDLRWGDPDLVRRAPSLRKHKAGPAYFFARPVLILCGETGAGKSSLAGALFRHAVADLGPEADDAAVDFARRARWVEARDVPEGGAAVAWRASLVVIDDVGQEGGAGESFAAQDRFRAMGDLLDRLYTHRVFGQSRGRIILTTYGTPDMWRKWYGAGVARRYWQDAAHVMNVKLERQ